MFYGGVGVPVWQKTHKKEFIRQKKNRTRKRSKKRSGSKRGKLHECFSHFPKVPKKDPDCYRSRDDVRFSFSSGNYRTEEEKKSNG